jgi:WD40 repeat protein
VRLWDPLTGELLATLPAGDSRWKLSFTPDGTRLIGGKIWDPGAGDQLLSPRNKSDPVLFKSITNQIRVRQRYNSLIHIFAGGAKLAAGSGERVALSWDRSLVADGLESGGIRIDDRTSAKTVKHIGMYDSPAIATAFSPDTTKVAAGYEDGVIKIWDLESGAERATLSGHTKAVYSVNYSPDGSRIVSGSDDRNIILWDTETYEQVAVLRGHTNYVYSVCFSFDGTMLASASGDCTVRIWDFVPPADRWEQIRQDIALRREAEPLVDQLLTELGDPLDVADHIRANRAMSSELRSAALRVLLKRSAIKRKDKPQ